MGSLVRVIEVTSEHRLILVFLQSLGSETESSPREQATHTDGEDQENGSETESNDDLAEERCPEP